MSPRPSHRLSYPTRLTVDIHSYCNARCSMCPYPEISKTQPMGKMDMALYRRIIDEFGAICSREGFRGRLGFCSVSEPFVEKNILQYVEYLKRYNIVNNFTTNAALLAPEVVDGLNALGFKGKFRISCHGIRAETVKRVMGLDVKPILMNVDYLVEHYPRERISVRAIPIDWPSGERAEAKRYWKERGVAISMGVAGDRAGLVSGYLGNDVRSLAGCGTGRPLNHMVINFNGDVVLCCNDMARRVVVGNIADDSLEAVWNGQRFREVVDQIYGRSPAPENLICRRCECAVWSTSWLASARSRAKRNWRRVAQRIGELSRRSR